MSTEAPGIYLIRNRVSGKVYVGSASNLSKRWSRHRKDLRAGKHSNVYMQSAWNKDGEQAFTFSILEIHARVDEALLTTSEQFWMDAYQCYRNEHGYNLCPVARSSRGRPGKPNPNATRHITDDDRRRGIATRARQMTLGNKLTEDQVREIRRRYGPYTGRKRPHGLETCGSLAKEYGVSLDTIARVVRRQSYAHIGED